ncbi:MULTISPECIES: sulfur carrier protein ThiS [Carboxydocella]|uniref:Thiamine biosynthesis protein ThiS n=2 Tax=Carboxydocella TaxID=178898 RepID=A0A1T4NLR1_9FIRM|nr:MULTISPECIES: sulfur carrier protein ThiS [Carboxydocella]AVX20100.1 sulfur carrier protein [Carboxydocella thermautotrophica]AVX30517.1 sulfur carrier protein [Carboxydocella thermautotrophica]SJZ80142.1 thiamine biosynthesis protein ThiS [Carboxydocella sporoproducens DSM 16521]GAW29189.1 thiamine biosynthesis protein ThiS [Carboxydocella sp. ULO1]GAW31747.1 thiamine biosynthesis protein ThiS [Carboxydocella sp. JDF658]
MVEILLNGQPTSIEAGTTIAALLASKNLNPQLVVVEVNREIIDRNRFAEVALNPGDQVEIVKFLGGG